MLLILYLWFRKVPSYPSDPPWFLCHSSEEFWKKKNKKKERNYIAIIKDSEKKVKVIQSCPTLCDSMYCTVHGILQVNTEVGSLSIFQGSFPNQGSNPGLPHCRWIRYQLSHKQSPSILEWVAYLFSSGSPNPGIKPRSPTLQVDSLPSELPRKLKKYWSG